MENLAKQQKQVQVPDRIGFQVDQARAKILYKTADVTPQGFTMASTELWSERHRIKFLKSLRAGMAQKLRTQQILLQERAQQLKAGKMKGNWLTDPKRVKVDQLPKVQTVEGRLKKLRDSNVNIKSQQDDQTNSAGQILIHAKTIPEEKVKSMMRSKSKQRTLTTITSINGQISQNQIKPQFSTPIHARKHSQGNLDRNSPDFVSKWTFSPKRKLAQTPTKSLPKLIQLIESCKSENAEYDMFMKTWDKKYDDFVYPKNDVQDLQRIKPVKTSLWDTLKNLKLDNFK